MEIKVHAKSDVIFLEVAGEIDLYNADRLKTRLLDLAQAPTNAASAQVIVDLVGVSYVDSSGIGALISGKGAIEKSGRSFVLCNPAASVRSVMRMTKLLSFFQVYESEQEALQAGRAVRA